MCLTPSPPPLHTNVRPLIYDCGTSLLRIIHLGGLHYADEGTTFRPRSHTGRSLAVVRLTRRRGGGGTRWEWHRDADSTPRGGSGVGGRDGGSGLGLPSDAALPLASISNSSYMPSPCRERPERSEPPGHTYTALQSQYAVTACFSSKQLLPIGFALQNSSEGIRGMQHAALKLIHVATKTK